MKILIFCYEGSFYWDPSDINTGLPGSEEAVVYVAEVLAKRGHQVTVFGNPRSNIKGNPTYIRLSLLPKYNQESDDSDDSDNFEDSNSSNDFTKDEDSDNSDDEYVDIANDDYDLVIVWRWHDPSFASRYGKELWVWLHDIVTDDRTAEMLPDKVLFLSKYHEKQVTQHIHGWEQVPRVIAGNGIPVEYLNRPMKPITNRTTIGYFSNYARGLLILLDNWNEIKKIFPQAILHVCYGKNTWGLLSHEEENQLVEQMDSLEGVIHHGKVGHSELQDIMEETCVWAYPCIDNGETFCITAIRTQVAGMIPVVSSKGALSEVLPAVLPEIKTTGDVKDYIQCLISTLGIVSDMSETELHSRRMASRTFGSTYTWDRVVDLWGL